MSDTTKDTKTTRRKRKGDDDTGLPDEDELYREPMRRDHFPIEKGDNQQDADYMAEIAAENDDDDLREQNVKWPEVDSQEALDEKIDEQQSDKDAKMLEAAREFDESARSAVT